MAADIHLGHITSYYFANQFVEKLNSINADIVLLPGDIVESYNAPQKMEYFEQLFRNIKSKYGVIAVEGNHELYGNSKKYKFFPNSNIVLLQDTILQVDSSFYLIGRRDRFDKTRKSVDSLMTYAVDNILVILLDHQPYNLQNAYKNDIDIQLSGHTHYGQLFPINFIINGIYELSWGYKKIRNTHFFVTCGAQGWGPPVKTGSRSEIMVIDVEFIEQNKKMIE